MTPQASSPTASQVDSPWTSGPSSTDRQAPSATPSPESVRTRLGRLLPPALGWLALAALPGCGADTEGTNESDSAATADSSDGAAPAAEAVPGNGLVILASEHPDDVGPVTQEALERAYFHSFGSVRHGKVVSHVFRLENTDARPVAIQSIKPGCGCTVPAVRYTALDGSVVEGKASPKDGEPLITIPPQAIAEVELEVDTRTIATKNSDKTVQTTITTDSPNGFYVKLETHIYVAQPFYLVPNGINFGRVPLSGFGEGSMELVPAPGYQLTVNEVTSVSDGVTVELLPVQRLEQTLWELSAILEPALEVGRWTGSVELSTLGPDGEPDEPLSIPLQADFVPDLSPSPSRIVFIARDTASLGSTVLSTLLPGHELRLLEATPVEHPELLEVTFTPENPEHGDASPSWILTMTAPNGSVPELLRGSVRVRIDDPQHPEVLIPYVVHPG